MVAVTSGDPAYLNGQYLPLTEAKIPVLDRGFIFGDGVYEVIPVYQGRPFRLPEHLNRLLHNLAAVKIPNPHTLSEWQHILEQLCRNSAQPEQKLYLQVSRGVAARDHAFPDCQPTVFAMSNRLAPPDRLLTELGASAITRPDTRWGNCDIKSTSLMANVLFRQIGVEQGADEVILIKDDLLTEASTSNVFLAKDGNLKTPPDSNFLLPGITRNLVLELAEQGQIPVQRVEITSQQLREADELMISSSTRELLPLTRLDGKPVGAGVPGPLWRRLYALYQEAKTASSSDGTSAT